MLSVETAVSSPTNSPSSLEDKPRARFEAFVMTGDAILNLSRATTTPQNVPAHLNRGRRRVEGQPSASTPTSPVEKISHQALLEKEPSPSSDAGSKNNNPPASSAVLSVRSSKSEETLNIKEESPKSKKSEERCNFSDEKLDGVKESDRIVWTYNAAPDLLSEKERRRYEADQFWLNTRTESTPRQQIKHYQLQEQAKVDEEVESNNSPTSDSNQQDPPCDTARQMAEQPSSAKEEEEVIKVVASRDDTAARPPLLTRSSTEEEGDADSLQSTHYSPKGVDMPSAIRLAKRYLDDKMSIESIP